MGVEPAFPRHHSEPVGLELPFLALIFGLGIVAWRPASARSFSVDKGRDGDLINTLGKRAARAAYGASDY